jgi:hypothetical protein
MPVSVSMMAFTSMALRPSLSIFVTISTSSSSNLVNRFLRWQTSFEIASTLHCLNPSEPGSPDSHNAERCQSRVGQWVAPQARLLSRRGRQACLGRAPRGVLEGFR